MLYRMVTLSMTLTAPNYPSFIFCTSFLIFIMGIVRNFKSGLWVNGSKSQPANDKLSLKGRGHGHVTVTHFRILHSQNISATATARDFKFCT